MSPYASGQAQSGYWSACELPEVVIVTFRGCITGSAADDTRGNKEHAHGNGNSSRTVATASSIDNRGRRATTLAPLTLEVGLSESCELLTSY